MDASDASNFKQIVACNTWKAALSPNQRGYDHHKADYKGLHMRTMRPLSDDSRCESMAEAPPPLSDGTTLSQSAIKNAPCRPLQWRLRPLQFRGHRMIG